MPAQQEMSAAVQQVRQLIEQGNWGEALQQLGRALAHQPGDRLWALAEELLREEPLPQRVAEADFCTFAALVVRPLDGVQPKQRRVGLQELLLAALGRFSYSTCSPRPDITDRYAVEVMLLRHMGRSKEALSVALAGLEATNAPYCAVFAASCYMDLNDDENAQRYARLGVQLNPGNAAGFNDLADYFFRKENYEKAMEYYGAVCTSGDHDLGDIGWAEPSYYYCRYLLQKDPVDLERLAAVAAADIQNEQASRLCDMARRLRQRPYVDYLPESSEATINLYRDMLKQGKKSSVSTVTVSCQEAASAIQAVRLGMGDYGRQPVEFRLIVSAPAQPSLEEPLVPDAVPLWLYDQRHDARPAQPAPGQAALWCVGQLAREPFQLGEWYRKAERLAGRLTPQDRLDLYACMTQPPRPQQELPSWVWLARVQAAAVCLLAHLPSPPAASQELREYQAALPSPELARICLGQLDWPVVPAFTLLAWQAAEGIAELAPVSRLMGRMLERVSHKNYCFFEHALVCALTWLPGQSEAFYRDMRARRRQLEEE